MGRAVKQQVSQFSNGSGSSNMLTGCLLLFALACQKIEAYETVNLTQIKIENNSGQKNYEEQEEGKVLPYR